MLSSKEFEEVIEGEFVIKFKETKKEVASKVYVVSLLFYFFIKSLIAAAFSKFRESIAICS